MRRGEFGTVTHPVLGRAVPVHFAMVELAGWGLLNPDQSPEVYWSDVEDWGFVADEYLPGLLRTGRAELIAITGDDYGFSLSMWHEFLIEQAAAARDDFGYSHPYAAGLVHPIVEEGLRRPGRADLEAVAEDGWAEFWKTYFSKLPERVQDRLTSPDTR